MACNKYNYRGNWYDESAISIIASLHSQVEAKLRASNLIWSSGKRLFLSKNKFNDARVYKNEINKEYSSPVVFESGDRSLLIDVSKHAQTLLNQGVSRENNLFQTEAVLGAPNEELNNKIKSFLQGIGVKYESMSTIRDSQGNLLDVVAKANLTKQIVEVVEGKSDISTLPEEAAHFFVEMLGTEHPTIRWMMNNISNYDIYQEVVDEYSEIYNNDETKLRKEAVGKLIARRIVHQFKDSNPNLTTEAKGWFKILWNRIRQIFSGLNSYDIQKEIDAYQRAADQILKGSTKGLKKITSSDEYYQISTPGSSADEVLNKLKEIQIKIIAPSYKTEGDDRYAKKTGEIIKNRVTDKQKRLFERKVGKEVAQEINKGKDSEIKRTTGVKLHKVAEGLVEHFANGESLSSIDRSMLNDKQYKALQVGVKDIVDQINEVQRQIDPNKKATFLTENIIYSESKDTAGSIDLLVVFSDGSVAIYDWKFITFETKGNQVIASGISQAKEEAYDLQISEYKDILKTEFGVRTVRKSRVVPINVQYSFVKDKSGKYNLTNKIKTLEIGEKDYLDQVPLADELTDDKRLNNLLETLLGIKKELKSTTRLKTEDTKLKARLAGINKAIKDIQLRKDVNSILDSAAILARDLNLRLSEEDINSPNYLTNSELKDYLNTLKIYKNISSDAENVLKESEEPEVLQARLDGSAGTLNRLEYAIYEKIKERIAEEAAKEGINNPLELQKESGMVGNLFRYLSDWDHPLFRLFNKFIKKSIDDTRRETNQVAEELETLNKALFDWYGKKDIKVFEYLVNKQTGNLVTEFQPNLYLDKNKAITDKNIKWLRANFEQTAEDKKKFEEVKKKYFDKIDKFYNYKTEVDRTKIKEQWLNKFDISRDTAWLNRKNYFISVKDKEKWQSNEYKYIQQNKPLKDYYNYYVSKNREFSEILPVDINKNFIPNIHKDLIDSISETGFEAIRNLKDTMIESLSVREQDEFMGIIDAKTGEPINTIPILYTNKLTNSAGQIDNTLKSYDLSRNMLLFAKMAYSYKHVSEIEDNVLLIREQLANQKQIVTDRLGRPIRKEIGEGFETAIGNKHTLEAFDTYMKFYLYGQSLQNKDFTYKIGDKTLSGSKSIRAAMNYLSVKALAFNPISIGANFVGGMTNTYLTAVKGRAYNRKQLAMAHTLLATQNEKYKALAKFFEIQQDDLTLIKAKNLSASRSSSTLTHENLFIGQRKGDEFVDHSITIAMAQNHGLDENNKIKRLDQLSEGSKSLWELATIAEDKVEIPGLTEESFNSFRRRVRAVTGSIKGTTSKEDISIIQTNILGQMLMQFRNWMPKTIKERFGSLKYNQDLEDYEMGRFRAGFGEIVHKGFIPALAKFTAEVASFSLYKYGANRQLAQTEYQKYLLTNPNLELTLDEYISLKESQLRALAAEVRMYAIVLGSIMALAGDWDDDDKPDYKEMWATRKLVKLMHRTALELGFFFSPSSATEIIKTPIPLSGLAVDLTRLMTNTGDETLDLLFGENNKRDKSNLFFYTSKTFPIINQAVTLFEVLEPEKKK